MVVDTANESQVAGLLFAVSTSIWEHPGQHIFHLVTLCYTFGNVSMKSEESHKTPRSITFSKTKSGRSSVRQMKGLLQAFHLPYQRASGHMRFKSYFPMLHQSEKPPYLGVPQEYRVAFVFSKSSHRIRRPSEYHSRIPRRIRAEYTKEYRILHRVQNTAKNTVFHMQNTDVNRGFCVCARCRAAPRRR